MFRTICTCTQLWSVMPSRREALTAETCQSALMWSLALTASSSCSSRRLPRVGARTRTSESASRGGIGGSGLDIGVLQQQALAQTAAPHLERSAEALAGGLQDQQSGRQQPHAIGVEREPACHGGRAFIGQQCE